KRIVPPGQDPNHLIIHQPFIFPNREPFPFLPAYFFAGKNGKAGRLPVPTTQASIGKKHEAVLLTFYF
ncbi:MAG TPA: hypothetical protein VK644_00610, partial [Chitinophagaceae bacterium]|nr:hypothetical protein [Chitinophagaceae bacterium]